MKAYLIDAVAKKVSEVTLPDDDGYSQLNAIYEHLQCTSIDAVRPPYFTGDVIYVDDEGLYKPKPWDVFSVGEQGQQRYVGRGLWVGTDADGNDRDPATQFSVVKALILFGV